ncbi:PolC-type DNA polymerase III [Lacticaseibacillus manihotivorans]|uniref:DNA polymerase III PolC-type n=2 Tax=Lacticaseibacillus manihotivorans TaxID=88233 RepID=A0A0R1QWT6_9LACO|nr:PolC-type DNA polymerase III [Lacticaseibacillus manihotivorans]KRL45803.1 DNA polymerase III PolC [Lacticaseibacillus manihotivorans DSM 13343 = JCM 12514]QFQ91309.1 PolC-type DNA polymerase III [Lacticaseibacillus manihotivorans]
MALSKHEMFTKLLEQLQLPQDLANYPGFNDATIDQVAVHTKSKHYHFTIGVPTILPVAVYTPFEQHLQAAFKDIASVGLSIKAENPSFDQALLSGYWAYVVKNAGIQSSLVYELCTKQEPKLNDGRVSLLAENEPVRQFLINQGLGKLEDAYHTVGFQTLHLNADVDEDKANAQIEAFKAQKAQETAELAKKAAEVVQQRQQAQAADPNAGSGPITLGRGIKSSDEPQQMVTITEEERSVTVEGYVFDVEVRELRSKRKLLIFKLTDYTSSFIAKKFSNNAEDEAMFDRISAGMWLRVRGSVQEDNFSRELTIMAQDVQEVKHPLPTDDVEGDKRIELHLHTNMSTMDGMTSISDYVKRAKKWGHEAIAVTDHAGLQAYPEAHTAAGKADMKMIYGVEVNLVDDGTPVAYNADVARPLATDTYVVFDIETTGLSAVYDKIIEIAAVKMQDGKVIDEFEELIDPGFPLSEFTINLTHITDDMVHGSKTEAQVLNLFREFCDGSIMVGHNVTFDVGFINAGYRRLNQEDIQNPVVDTLELSRMLHPERKNHKLDTLTKAYKIALENHHRANADSEATGYLLYALEKEAAKKYNITTLDQLNSRVGAGDAWKQSRPSHAIILAKTQEGLKNLFKLVSISNVETYYRMPRVPRSRLQKLRDGLVVGSACSSGEVFTAMMQKGYAEAAKKAEFYDYLEVQPLDNYLPLKEAELVKGDAHLKDIISNIIKIGAAQNKPVVATGDAHYLDKTDAVYRKILIHSQGGANPLNRHSLPDVHFRSTKEMLDAFSWLPEDQAHQIVVDNTHVVADWIDGSITPVKTKLYTPDIPGVKENLTKDVMDTAHKLYGDPLPEIVSARLDKELKSIIGNGFAVIYNIAQQLVLKSNKDGYLVGSRGSVGSSLAATMSGITEINPLPPHYRCPQCQYSEFFTKGEYGSGFDLPDKDCPNCGAELVKDGQDIPFETFLGFKGDKVPDIDLNFSGDYQPVAHNYIKVLFGEDHAFRAGTIGTVADKTAYGYVKAYERDTGQMIRGAEIDRLAKGATGVKRTTGQHPAGILIVPANMDIYDFSPIQYPADDQNAAWKTTHFDFHSIHDNILKMDVLGHDDPTMIRMLQDLSGVEPKSIPMDDPGVMSLFSSTEALGVTPEQIGSKTGTLGVPEFGTRFVRGMLEETHPKHFSELLQISGLSHGTDVWLGNAEELIQNKVVTIKEVIGCRDNIMMDLIHWGMDDSMAFNIMEHVRKGRGIPDEWQQAMRDNESVPDWYIDSCLKIKYMFPKAHAAAYDLMGLRIAWFKVYFPLVYYASYFSVRAEDFDLAAMSHGKEAVKAAIKEITDKGMEASTKEKNLQTILEIANECLERGFKIQMVDIDKSDAHDFLIVDDHTLLAPFRAVPSLGDNVAKQIVSAREEKPFLSKEDLAKRGKVSKTLIDYMTENHVLDHLPDENQLSLFDGLF